MEIDDNPPLYDKFREITASNRWTDTDEQANAVESCILCVQEQIKLFERCTPYFHPYISSGFIKEITEELQNQLKELPQFNDNLFHLNCSYNQLKVIPQLNNVLIKLICKFNELTKLPNLNYNLIYLNC